MFAIACEFGVGYNTLLTHLSVSVNMLSYGRAKALRRTGPKAIRTDILGEITCGPLVVADLHRISPTLDTEVKSLLLLPAQTEVAGEGLVYERDLAVGRLFRAARPGIVRATAETGRYSSVLRPKLMWDLPNTVTWRNPDE